MILPMQREMYAILILRCVMQEDVEDRRTKDAA